MKYPSQPDTPKDIISSSEAGFEGAIANADKDTMPEHAPDLPDRLPVLPVRDVVIFNYTILPLFVGRESSVQAVEAALARSRYMLILTQKDEQVDKPGPEDLHRVGTVVMILRMLKLPDGRLKLLVQGVSRARALAVLEDKPYLEAEVLPLPRCCPCRKPIPSNPMWKWKP